MKLTDTICHNAKANSGYVDFNDEGTSLFLRVKKNGEKEFFWRGRIDGRQKKEPFGLFSKHPMEGEFNVAMARHEAQRMSFDAKRGASTIVPPVGAAARKEAKSIEATTVRDAFDTYYKLRLADLADGAGVKGIITKHIFPDFGDRALRSLTRRELNDWFNQKKLDRAGPGLNRVLSAFKTFLKWCTIEEYIDFSPAATIEKKIKEEPRKRMLAGDELAAVQWAISDCGPYAVPLTLLLHSCCRRSDIFGLTWRSLRTDEDGNPELFIPETKGEDGGVPHIVPLSPQALALIPPRPEKAKLDDLVFPDICFEPGSPLNDKANIRAQHHSQDDKFPRFRFHDFRSACVTYLGGLRGRGKQSFSDRAKDMLLAHIPVGVTRKHYDHSDALEERREMLELWSNHLEACSKSLMAKREKEKVAA